MNTKMKLKADKIDLKELESIRTHYKRARDYLLEEAHPSPETPREKQENRRLHKEWHDATEKADAMKLVIALLEEIKKS